MTDVAGATDIERHLIGMAAMDQQALEQKNRRHATRRTLVFLVAIALAGYVSSFFLLGE